MRVPRVRTSVYCAYAAACARRTFECLVSRSKREIRVIMSAELGRKAPYSSDLRWRVVWQRIGMELTFREIANNLCLSLGTVHNHFKRFQMTCEVAPTVSNRDSTRKLSQHDELIIIGLLLDDPSLYIYPQSR